MPTLAPSSPFVGVSARPPARLDKPGLLFAALAVGGLAASFVTFRANRIVAGEGRFVWEATPPLWLAAFGAATVLALAAALFSRSPAARLAAGLVAVFALVASVGAAAASLAPSSDRLARVSVGAGAWLLLAAFCFMIADALAKLRLSPWRRMGLLVAVVAALAAMLSAGWLDRLSVMREYANGSARFWSEALTHVLLAFGSMAAAVVVGAPLGVLAYRSRAVRGPLLSALNVVQTIPSIALFGLLIPPLAWVAANVPAAARLGVAGVGYAPAAIALFLYSLLPVVSNVVVGLETVPPEVDDAARGMGMTDRQRLWRVDLPLAFPVILAAVRVVMVQNIGLAVVAGLIGGGGFGAFVFQGLNQNAADLILLGALPTVFLATVAAAVLDAVIDLNARPARMGAAA